MLSAESSVCRTPASGRAGHDRFGARGAGDINSKFGHWCAMGGALLVDERAALADAIHGTVRSSYLLVRKDFSTLLMSSDAGIWSPPAIRRINASEGCRSPRSSLPK